MKGLNKGKDEIYRCWWCGEDPLYQHYHDHEWGRPVENDILLFEKICLEGFQAGLSWLTILRKRENFRQAFAGFDFTKVAFFTEADVAELLQNKGIVRHEQKIRSTINNAQKTLDIIEEYGSLYAFLRLYQPCKRERPKKLDYQTLVHLASTSQSAALSRELKKKGFSFVGPTTMYALMQATGLVNDHIEGCSFRSACGI